MAKRATKRDPQYSVFMARVRSPLPELESEAPWDVEDHPPSLDADQWWDSLSPVQRVQVFAAREQLPIREMCDVLEARERKSWGWFASLSASDRFSWYLTILRHRENGGNL